MQKPPNIRLLPVNSPEQGKPFLHIERKHLIAEYPNGTRSKPFFHDGVGRKLIDAVGIVAFFRNEEITMARSDAILLYLRSCVRPNVEVPNMWEIAAGLVEEGESPEESAVREVEEELGFTVNVQDMRPLGPAFLPCPGISAERISLYAIEVDPNKQKTPTEDGGALERYGEAVAFNLKTIKNAITNGEIIDAKTEIAVRRFEDVYPNYY